MNTLKLSNGAVIYQFGKPNAFIMSGVHGEERAGVMALNKFLIKHQGKINNTWILPCLNIEGFENQNRLCGTINLADEFREDTDLKFMQELLSILENNKPHIFVDLHEDCESDADYVWTHWDNFNLNPMLEENLRDFCRKNSIGLKYWPDSKYYDGTGEKFARNILIPSAYTTETFLYQNLDVRIKRNLEFAEQFYKMGQLYG